jgi:hypothetical protein
MKMRDIREFIKGEKVTHLEIEYEGVRYDVQDMIIDSGAGRKPHVTVVLRLDRFDEIDGTGIRGGDFV